MHAAKAFACLVASVGGVCAVAARAQADPPPVRHEGRTLEQWVAQLDERSEERTRDAVRALGRARFLVGADELVVPALGELVTGSGVTMFTALGALQQYGPLAKSLEPKLAAFPDTTGELLVTRIRIGMEVRPLLDELEARWAKARKAFLDGATRDSYELAGEVRTSSGLGRRGEPAVAFIRGLLDDARTRGWVAFDALNGMMAWGPIAAPLAGVIPIYLADKEASIRGRAALALAWLPGLGAGEEKALFKAAQGFASGPFTLGITRGVALTPEHPAESVVALLRGRASSGDAAVAAWANAGLARRVPEAERPKLVVTLLGQLKNANAEARAGAADGLLALAAQAEPALPDLQAALADPDLRVRWRAAAALVRFGKGIEGALPELARGIDGPDDGDRVAAFDAIAGLGAVAEPLGARIEPWTKVPFPWIAKRAQRALDAVKPK